MPDGGEAGAEQVHVVQQEGRAAGVRLPLRRHLLLAAPLQRRAPLRLRLQDGRPRADRQEEPARRGAQDQQDLMQTETTKSSPSLGWR